MPILPAKFTAGAARNVVNMAYSYGLDACNRAIAQSSQRPLPACVDWERIRAVKQELDQLGSNVVISNGTTLWAAMDAALLPYSKTVPIDSLLAQLMTESTPPVAVVAPTSKGKSIAIVAVPVLALGVGVWLGLRR